MYCEKGCGGKDMDVEAHRNAPPTAPLCSQRRGVINEAAQARNKHSTPDTKATATKRALASNEEDDHAEEAASSFSPRPTKRARTTTTTRHSGGLDIQVGERLEVEWNDTYYPATVVAITPHGLPNVK